LFTEFREPYAAKAGSHITSIIIKQYNNFLGSKHWEMMKQKNIINFFLVATNFTKVGETGHKCFIRLTVHIREWHLSVNCFANQTSTATF
jgi:hypothetical protein